MAEHGFVVTAFVTGALMIALCSGCTTTQTERIKTTGKYVIGGLTIYYLLESIESANASTGAYEAQEDYWNRN